LPIYEYRCRNGHTFEVMQSMSDDPVAACQTCDAPVERVFHPVAVHFKGSGFYTTDYGRNRSGAGADSGSKDESKSESKSDSKDTTSTTSESKSSTGSSSSSSDD
jgi:putative FmdB family regulatory protein